MLELTIFISIMEARPLVVREQNTEAKQAQQRRGKILFNIIWTTRSSVVVHQDTRGTVLLSHYHIINNAEVIKRK